jgi:hypothetical protein
MPKTPSELINFVESIFLSANLSLQDVCDKLNSRTLDLGHLFYLPDSSSWPYIPGLNTDMTYLPLDERAVVCLLIVIDGICEFVPLTNDEHNLYNVSDKFVELIAQGIIIDSGRSYVVKPGVDVNSNALNYQLFSTLYLGHYAKITDKVVDLGASKLKNIANASEGTDAVNKDDLDAAIQTQTDRIDSILSGVGAEYDTLRELVDYVNNLDGTGTGAILQTIGSLSSEVLDLSNNIVPQLNSQVSGFNNHFSTTDASVNDVISKNQALEEQVNKLYQYFFNSSRSNYTDITK